MTAVCHLTSTQLAERLGVTEQALKEWRRDGRGPNYIRDGRKFIRYPLAEVVAWEKSRLVRTSQAA
jgi:predicted DNA-binding transcriptional regulator AlpA